MNVKKGILLRVRIVFVLVAPVALAIVGRLVMLQWVQGDHWRKIAEQNQLKQDKVRATRGNIFSDNGSLLATSLPFYRVAFDPTAAEKEDFKEGIDSLAMLLAGYYNDAPAREYKTRLVEARREGRQFLYISRQTINYQAKKQMMNWPLFRKGRIKGGVIFEKHDTRYRPFYELAKRTVGFLNESAGGAGLEFTFNRQLAGVDGVSLFRRLAGGHWKPIYDEVLPVEGLDISTTIDVNLQDVAETALEKALNYHHADNGCVVLMEVATGKIKAIANLGIRADDTYSETYNYALAHRTEPGSTFKLASYMALFEENAVQLSDSVFCEWGEKKYADRTMTDAHKGGYGNLSVKQAFEKSSNIAVSKLVHQHFRKEPQRFLDYLDRFGLSASLDFQIKGAAPPYIKRMNDHWSGTTLPWMSVGYEVSLTPLQTLAFYNAVANNGDMIQPVIVEEIRRADEVTERFEPKILRKKICSEATLAKVREMLEGVVENGTAYNIKHADYRIAGKTGTAQKFMDGSYTQRYYTSFAGYFPAEKPKYSAIVVIDNPKGYNLYGADVAAPVFKEVADKVYARDIEMHKELEPADPEKAKVFPVLQAGNYETLHYLCNQFGISNYAGKGAEAWVRADVVNRSVKWRPAEPVSGLVPDVRGMMLRDALYLLENKGLRVNIQGQGRVRTQSVSPGARCNKGMQVVLEMEG